LVVFALLSGWNIGIGGQSVATRPSPEPPKQYGGVTVGDIYKFGGYDWRVLDIRDDQALIITDRVIGYQRYHNGAERVKWVNCDLRAWLNDDFYNSLDAKDRDRIVETRNVNEANQWYGEGGGENTTDKVFLLSLDEVVRYFGDSGQLAKGTTDSTLINDRYNSERIARDDEGMARHWWLRSTGRSSYNAAHVVSNGFINVAGLSVNTLGDWDETHIIFVRPALWLKLQ
jgi:hypothetical protein